MSIRTYFDSLFALVPPDEPIVISRERWTWIVTNHDTCADSGVPALTSKRVVSEPQVLLTRDLARAFRCGESTMRAHLSAGLCGDPRRLRAHGRRFELFPDSIHRIRAALGEGQVLGSFCLAAGCDASDDGIAVRSDVESHAPQLEIANTPSIRDAGELTVGNPAAAKSSQRSVQPIPRRRRRRHDESPDLARWRTHVHPRH